MRVPVGTQVFDGDDLSPTSRIRARASCSRAAAAAAAGNARFVSSTRQVPRFAEVGHARARSATSSCT